MLVGDGLQVPNIAIWQYGKPVSTEHCAKYIDDFLVMGEKHCENGQSKEEDRVY